jgi:hypothetical protein
VTWQPGRDKIAELLEAAELQQVTADHRIAQRLLDDAGRHLATAAAASSSGDLAGAYQLGYDALRKSAASLLAMPGLRATSRSGHIAIQEAARAQFGSTVKAFRSFSRILRARNNFEYPSTITSSTPAPSHQARLPTTCATRSRPPPKPETQPSRSWSRIS